MFNHFRLHGEKPLSLRSVECSSNAYDRNLLSRIGKPNSPPRSTSGDSSHSANIPFHSKRPGIPSLSLSDAPYGGSDQVSRWMESPSSAAISPGSRPWKDYDFLRSVADSSAPSVTADSDPYGSRRGSSRQSTQGSLSIPFDDQSSMTSRSNRGSYDHAVFQEHDSDFPAEETGQLRQLNIGEHATIRPSSSKQSLKRRASSPPRDGPRDDRQSLQVGGSQDSYSRRSSGHHPASRSPNMRYQPSHGSVSSISSAGLRNGSYASSAGLSIGGSSMTSLSSQYDRHHSPGGHSPASDTDMYHDPHYATSTSVHPSPRDTSSAPLARGPPHRPPHEHVRSVNPIQDGQILGPKLPSGVQRIGGQFMCECCPKKPKKFNTGEELR